MDTTSTLGWESVFLRFTIVRWQAHPALPLQPHMHTDPMLAAAAAAQAQAQAQAQAVTNTYGAAGPYGAVAGPYGGAGAAGPYGAVGAGRYILPQFG